MANELTPEQIRTIVNGLPPEAVVLAEQTSECNLVYRLEDRVKKILKRGVLTPQQIKARQAIIADHSDLFVETNYDKANHVIDQPFIEGPHAVKCQVDELRRVIGLRGLLNVGDIGSANVLIHFGPRVVDFSVNQSLKNSPPGITRIRGGFRVVGCSREILEKLGWPIPVPPSP